MRRKALGLGFVLVSAIFALPASAASQFLVGQWGGPDANLWATEAGVNIEMGCASASIPLPVLLDQSGHFDVNGSITRGQSGAHLPVESSDAEFIGDVRGDNLELVIWTDEEEGHPIEMQLWRGVHGAFAHCE